MTSKNEPSTRDRFAPLRTTRDAFWGFVRSMGHYRRMLAICLVAALLSGSSLGVGIIGASPIFESILTGRKDLRAVLTELNGKIERALDFSPWLARTVGIPRGWIEALPPGEPLHAIAWILGGLLVLTVVGALANFVYSYCALTVVNRTVASARQRAFRAVVRAPALSVAHDGPLDAVSRIINDSTQMGNGLTTVLSKAIIQSLKGVVGFGVALFFNWKVTLVAIVVAPVLYTIVRKLGKRVRRSSERALEGQAELTARATESLQALRVVKTSNAEARAGASFHRANMRVLHELNTVRTARAIASPLTESLALLVLAGMVLAVGKAVLDGGVAPKDFVLSIVSLGIAGASIKPLTNLAQDIQHASPAASRLRDLILREPEPGLGRGLPRLPRHRESIELQNVRVLYPGRERPALDGVSLTIRFGERVAFVGPNGSGKSTLLSLVTRLIEPQAGRVLLDGHDIGTHRVRSLRSQIGVVTQETVLMRGTIADNLRYARLGTSEAQLREAAARAGASVFIESLPMGYDTPVAEQGTSLSGGQRQRIAIARALLRDPSILILDEATSMIDAESEAAIAEAVREFGRGRTVLIVAHRLSTVVSCDRIYVLDAGKVIDAGTHAALMARCALYQSLARHQLAS